MITPVEIHFHGIEKSEAIEERVRWKVSKLEKHFGRITRCRVVLEAPHRSPTKPKVYQIKIELSLPRQAAHRGEPRARRQSRQRGAAAGPARRIRGGAAQGRRRRQQDHRPQQARARPPPATAHRARWRRRVNAHPRRRIDDLLRGHLELDALRQREGLAVVDGVGGAPHIGLPCIRAGFATAAGLLFAAESAADLGALKDRC